MSVHRVGLSLLAVVTVLAAACGAGAGGDPVGSTGTPPAPPAAAGDFASVLQEADGQTVQWWLYGGDDRVNGYVDDHVVPAAAALGVTLQRVPLADTADAVQRVLAETRAGEQAGSVDLVWINGENCAAGREAGLWLQDWARDLPNAALVDPATVATDFGIPVEGQESPWSRALFVFAHDSARLPEPPATLDEVMAFAEANPGRFTYPAPPDFTGSAFVRQVVAALGEDEAMAWLDDLEPLLWEQGRTYPGSAAELNQLFANDQVDIAMSYDPGFVQTGVAQGTFPTTTRPFVWDRGTLNNVSYVTIPANAANRAGALVVANLLLEPRLQAAQADPAVLGVPTVLDLARLDPDQAAAFASATDTPWLLDDPGELLPELPVERVETIEARWRREVLS